jgi:hypothetical protein
MSWVVSCSVGMNKILEHGLLKSNSVESSRNLIYPTEIKHQNDVIPYTMLSEAIALQQIEAGNLDPRRVLVIQHGTEKASQRLVDLGAVPFMLMNFESPLYSGDFYDQLDELEEKFIFSQVFSSMCSESAKRRSARFPSFQLESIQGQTGSKWEIRHFASMVVSNKYVALQSFNDIEGVEEFLWWLANQLRHLIRGNPAPVSFDLRDLQLQDKRLEAIGYFCKLGKLDLYGHGWDSLWRIPPKYRKKIYPLIGRSINTVDDKINLLKRYKFNLCFENVRYPGYITEKIFDAMIANTIPVYFGAPDIADFVPYEAFIDASVFSDFEELHSFMSDFTADTAATMLTAAQTFLHSKDGLQYSKEWVALSVFEKIKVYVDGR